MKFLKSSGVFKTIDLLFGRKTYEIVIANPVVVMLVNVVFPKRYKRILVERVLQTTIKTLLSQAEPKYHRVCYINNRRYTICMVSCIHCCFSLQTH